MVHFKELLCYFLLCLFLGSCKKDGTEEEIVRSVKTMTVSSSSGIGTRQLSGVLKPSDESDLSFQVGGNVKGVEAKLGDVVKKGQLLAFIDPRDYELKLQSAQAALESAQATVSTASEDLKRQKSLVDKGYSSRATYEKSKAQYEAAVSKEKLDRSLVEEATRDLERTKLGAPFNGKISLRSIEPHQETQPGRVVFKLQSKEGLKVEVLVPESLIRSITLKQRMEVLFPTLKNVQVSGTVREISAQSNVANAFPVTIDLLESKADLRPGMSALVVFTESQASKSSVYLIPLTAIDTKPQSTLNPAQQQESTAEKIVSIYLYDKGSSTVKKHPVTIRDIYGNQLEVIKGLKEGDVVVTAGVPFLEDGEKVTLWHQKYRSPETDR
jgi:RND family efflux transporter MFP subunit